jgi:predicted ATPase
MSYYKRREAEIREAISEARRFIKRAESTLEEMINSDDSYFGGSENASMKRASLDLNNALVKLRKPLL